MKTLIYLFFAICCCSTTYAQETGTIYFMRKTGISGTVSAFNAFIDGKLVCRLNNKKFSAHEVPAGEHIITVQFSGKNAKDKAEPNVSTIPPESVVDF